MNPLLTGGAHGVPADSHQTAKLRTEMRYIVKYLLQLPEFNRTSRPVFLSSDEFEALKDSLIRHASWVTLDEIIEGLAEHGVLFTPCPGGYIMVREAALMDWQVLDGDAAEAEIEAMEHGRLSLDDLRASIKGGMQ